MVALLSRTCTSDRAGLVGTVSVGRADETGGAVWAMAALAVKAHSARVARAVAVGRAGRGIEGCMVQIGREKTAGLAPARRANRRTGERSR
ncbi:hypothetical protein D3C72_1853300 [compost metagenome]